MAIVTLSSLPDANLSKESQIFIGDKYKSTLEKLEAYMNPNGSFVYGGRNLIDVLGASNFSDAVAKLKGRSDAGNFAGLRLGDYLDIPSLTINGTTYTSNSSTKNLRVSIHDFDYFLGHGNIEIIDHHIVMGFENCPLTAKMNETNTNEGGYEATELCKNLDGSNGYWKTALTNAGFSLKTVSLLIENSKTNYSWYNHIVFLPSTTMTYGYRAWAENEYGFTANGQPMQLGLYKVAPFKRIKRYNGVRQWWWQMNPAYNYTDPSICFCNGSSHGDARCNTASYSGGISPLFII